MAEQNRHIAQQEKSTYIEQGVVTINYGEKKIPKNLTKPPFVPDVFIGREEDITAVHEKLFTGDQLLLLVNGEGGIGKTTLASHYYRRYQKDYHHLAWVFAETSLLDALMTLALPLQVDFSKDLSTRQQFDLLLAKMADLEKPCLLIIDNANDLQDLENYYQALHSCANFQILLTTRITEFAQAPSHKIDSLKPEDALSLFKKHYPGHQTHENPLLKDILIAVGFNTLVIELLAKNLKQLNRLKTHYTLAKLLADLQQKGLLALKSSSVITTYQAEGTALRKETPETIIAAMYDLEKLSDAETALLSVFAVLPAENMAFSMLETLLSGVENLDGILLDLTQKGWLDNEADADFKVSPVVQEIIRQKNQVRLLQDNQILIDKLNEKLTYEPGTGHFTHSSYEEAALFARYAENTVHSITEPTEELAILYERLGNYHNTTGNLNKALKFFEEYSSLGKELFEDYPDDVAIKHNLAISYEKLGETHSARGDLERALAFFEKFSSLEKELFEDYPDNVAFKNGLAIAYEKLGETHFERGDLERALMFYEKYSSLEKELFKDCPDNVAFKNGLAISYIQLGSIYEKKENQSKAKEYYLLSKDLLTQLTDRFPQYVEFKNNLDWVVDRLSGDSSQL